MGQSALSADEALRFADDQVRLTGCDRDDRRPHPRHSPRTQLLIVLYLMTSLRMREPFVHLSGRETTTEGIHDRCRFLLGGALLNEQSVDGRHVVLLEAIAQAHHSLMLGTMTAARILY